MTIEKAEIDNNVTHMELVAALAKNSDEIMDDLNSYDCHLIHMIMGVCGETGELLDAIKKSVIYRKELDMANIIEELGDIEFYLEGLRQGLGLNRGMILSANIAKLNKRYASGSYSNEQANDRADKKVQATEMDFDDYTFDEPHHVKRDEGCQALEENYWGCWAKGGPDNRSVYGRGDTPEEATESLKQNILNLSHGSD